jgi:hypothetical protein
VAVAAAAESYFETWVIAMLLEISLVPPLLAAAALALLAAPVYVPVARRAT